MSIVAKNEILDDLNDQQAEAAGLQDVHPSRQRKPRPKPSRFVKVVLTPSTVNPYFIIAITERTPRTTTVTHYAITPIGSDMGRAFHVRKLGMDFSEYDVLVHADPAKCSCEC